MRGPEIFRNFAPFTQLNLHRDYITKAFPMILVLVNPVDRPFTRNLS